MEHKLWVFNSVSRMEDSAMGLQEMVFKRALITGWTFGYRAGGFFRTLKKPLGGHLGK